MSFAQSYVARLKQQTHIQVIKLAKRIVPNKLVTDILHLLIDFVPINSDLNELKLIKILYTCINDFSKFWIMLHHINEFHYSRLDIEHIMKRLDRCSTQFLQIFHRMLQHPNYTTLLNTSIDLWFQFNKARNDIGALLGIQGPYNDIRYYEYQIRTLMDRFNTVRQDLLEIRNYIEQDDIRDMCYNMDNILYDCISRIYDIIQTIYEPNYILTITQILNIYNTLKQEFSNIHDTMSKFIDYIYNNEAHILYNTILLKLKSIIDNLTLYISHGTQAFKLEHLKIRYTNAEVIKILDIIKS